MKRLIDEEDAIRAICKNCYAEDGGDYKDCRYYPCDDVQAIEALPSTDLERIKAIMKKANEQDKHMGRPTDLISRADAIEAVMAEGRKVYTSEYANAERVIHEADAVEALSMLPSAEQVTSKLESAEAVQGWIPVEEQPPEFPCLVCDANGNQPSVPLGIVTITDEEHGEWHIDGRLWDTKIFFKGEWCSQTGYGNRIIAWMPLPKPYKGGDDE